ncbi:Putative ciliary rootlet coiled-coil protein 2 [Pleodorina starrii]|nr:Putative ciliary rootlet coiled-coil protein 2 [Pleodorina starrii]
MLMLMLLPRVLLPCLLLLLVLLLLVLLQDWSLHVTLEPLVTRDLMVQQAAAAPMIPFKAWLRAASLLMGGEKLKRKQISVYWYDSVAGKEAAAAAANVPSALVPRSAAPRIVGVWRSATIIDFDADSGMFTVKYHTDHKKLQSHLYLPITLLHFARMPPAPGTAPRNVAEGFQPLPPVILAPLAPQEQPRPPLLPAAALAQPQQQLLLPAAFGPPLPVQPPPATALAAQLLSAHVMQHMPGPSSLGLTKSTAVSPEAGLGVPPPAPHRALVGAPPASAATGQSALLSPAATAVTAAAATASAAAPVAAATTGVHWASLHDRAAGRAPAEPTGTVQQQPQPQPQAQPLIPLAAMAMAARSSLPFPGTTNFATAAAGGAAEANAAQSPRPAFGAGGIGINGVVVPSAAGATLAQATAGWQQQLCSRAAGLAGFQGAQAAAASTAASMTSATAAAAVATAIPAALEPRMDAATAASVGGAATAAATSTAAASSCNVFAAANSHPAAATPAASAALPHALTAFTEPIHLAGLPPFLLTQQHLKPARAGGAPVPDSAEAAAEAAAAAAAAAAVGTNAATAAAAAAQLATVGARTTVMAAAAAAAADTPSGAQGSVAPGSELESGVPSSATHLGAPVAQRPLLGTVTAAAAANALQTTTVAVDLYGTLMSPWTSVAAGAGAAVAGVAAAAEPAAGGPGGGGSAGATNGGGRPAGSTTGVAATTSALGRSLTPPPPVQLLGSSLADGAFLDEMLRFLSSGDHPAAAAAAPHVVATGATPSQSAPSTLTGFTAAGQDVIIPTNGGSAQSELSNRGDVAGSNNNRSRNRSFELPAPPARAPMQGSVSAAAAAAAAAAPAFGGAPMAAASAAAAAAAAAAADRDEAAWAGVRREVRRLENLCSWTQQGRATATGAIPAMTALATTR